MSRRTLALGVASGSLAMVAAGAVLLLLTLGTTRASIDQNTVGGFLLAFCYPLIGGLICWRQPGNRIGWVFLGIGLSQALETLAGQYAAYGVRVEAGNLPGVGEMAWLQTFAWVPGYVLFVVFSILLFPNGRLPSPRWRPVAALAIAAVPLLAVPAVAAWPYRNRPALIMNSTGPQIGVDDPLVKLAFLVQTIGLVGVSVAALASICSLLLRFRGARGLERQQLKWFTYAGTAEIVVLTVTNFAPLPQGLLATLSFFLIPLLPIAVAIAMLRHRLFDIDLVINRTLVYGALTVMLATVYAGSVIVLQALLSGLTGGGNVAIATATLAVAAAFQPLRRRVQRGVDRRFYRSRYDAARTVEAFASRLRAEVDLSQLTDELATTIEHTLQPAALSIWLRTRSRR